MTADQSYDLALPLAVLAWDVGPRDLPDVTQAQLRDRARELRAVAHSALASGRVVGQVRDYFDSVLAFTGVFVD
jgi:hypothetical protein